MAKQMLIDAMRGKQTDVPPWLPYAGVHCAALIDQPADAFLKDAELLAKGVVKAAELYHADGIPLMFDLSVEAESIGCEATYWEDNVPSIMAHLCIDKTPDELCKGLSEAGLPNLFIPSPDSFLEIEELPILGTGKLDLKRVREIARERFGT